MAWTNEFEMSLNYNPFETILLHAKRVNIGREQTSNSTENVLIWNWEGGEFFIPAIKRPSVMKITQSYGSLLHSLLSSSSSSHTHTRAHGIDLKSIFCNLIFYISLDQLSTGCHHKSIVFFFLPQYAHNVFHELQIQISFDIHIWIQLCDFEEILC